MPTAPPPLNLAHTGVSSQFQGPRFCMFFESLEAVDPFPLEFNSAAKRPRHQSEGGEV